MILLNKKIIATSLAQWINTKDLIGGIRNNKSHQIKLKYSTPLINNLKTKFFKDKGLKEEVGITTLINRIIQVLKKDLY